MPFLTKYIGGYAEIDVPSAEQTVKKGNSIEVSEAIAAALLMDPVNWEAGNAETLEIVPKYPTAISLINGYGGPWDKTTVYSSGVVTEEGGNHYLSLKASVAETPSRAPTYWQQLAPTVATGVPGIMVPMMSLGSVCGREGAYQPPALKILFSRMIVPKTGKLADLSIYNLTKNAGIIRVGLYDCGQAANKVFTQIGSPSATAEQGGATKYQSFGSLGAPSLIAGQHLVFGLAHTGTMGFGATFTGPLEGLPESYLPGRVPGYTAMKYLTALTEALTFPATIAEASMAPEDLGVHCIARIT